MQHACYVSQCPNEIWQHQSRPARDDVPLVTDTYPEHQPASQIFPAKQIAALSIALIVFGGCSMLFNAVGLANGVSLLVISPGFYCGGFVSLHLNELINMGK
jgi:hypothetical protein